MPKILKSPQNNCVFVFDSLKVLGDIDGRKLPCMGTTKLLLTVPFTEKRCMDHGPHVKYATNTFSAKQQ